MRCAMQDRGATEQTHERLKIHGDLRDAKGEDAEATACERFDCEARPHVKRSKGHRYSVMARYVSERIWPQ